MGITIWLKGMRPQTLPASVAPVAIGAAAAWSELHGWACAPEYDCSVHEALRALAIADFWPLAILCALVALFLQIAVNYANDYSDGIRGVDAGRGAASAATVGIPPTSTGFSGTRDGVVSTSIHAPARLVASGVPPKRVLAAAGIAASLACLCGLTIIVITGYWWLLVVGVCCLLAGWCYTGGRHPYGYDGLGELFVFVFFGLVAVLGTQFVLCGDIDGTGVRGAAQAGLLSCVLLMANNLRDVEEDRAHGKRTLAVRLGARRARILTVAAYAIAFVPMVVLTLMPLVLSVMSLAGLPCWWETSSWVSVDSMGEQHSGSSGGWVCASPSPPDSLTWVFAAYGIICLVIAVLTVRALLRRDHARALPLVGVSLLVCAAGYVGLAAI